MNKEVVLLSERASGGWAWTEPTCAPPLLEVEVALGAAVTLGAGDSRLAAALARLVAVEGLGAEGVAVAWDAAASGMHAEGGGLWGEEHALRGAGQGAGARCGDASSEPLWTHRDAQSAIGGLDQQTSLDRIRSEDHAGLEYRAFSRWADGYVGRQNLREPPPGSKVYC